MPDEPDDNLPEMAFATGLPKSLSRTPDSIVSAEITPATLELKVDGTAGGISLRSFTKALENLVGILRDLDVQLSRIGDGPPQERRPALEWYVVNLRMSSLAAWVEPRPVKSAEDIDPREYGYLVGREMISGLEGVEEVAVAPPYFGDTTLKRVERLGGIAGKNGATGVVVTMPYSDQLARVTKTAADHAKAARSPSFHARGSTVGRLETMSVAGRKPSARVFEDRSRRQIPCDFPSSMLDEVKDAFGQRVVAHGEVYRNAAGQLVRVAVDGIEQIPQDDLLPTVDDIFGIAPGITGGLRTEDFIEELRGA